MINKLNFKDANITVDWIGFKFQNLNELQQKELAQYFFNLGFNSYLESGKLAKPIKESILVNDQNLFEICFVNNNAYWSGTLLHFSGRNADRFYFLCKDKVVDLNVFSSASLSRLDVYYFRKNNKLDKLTSSDFLNYSYNQVKQKNKKTKVNLETNSKGSILKIGNRRSNRCSRVYQKTNSLRFELEMKGNILINYQSLLVTNEFEKLETKISCDFIKYFGKLLPLEYSYTDWLVRRLRPMKQQQLEFLGLKSDYIQSGIKTDPIKLVNMIRFLHFAQKLDFKMDSLGGTQYRVVTFKLQDFIGFQNQTNNYYQLKKMKDFFNDLQTGILVQSFSDKFFQSLVAIPLLKFKKENKFVVIQIWLVNQLFYYKYPFVLPDLFETKFTKHELAVRYELFQSFTSIEIEKTIHINKFFDSYPSALNNNQKKKMKEHFIELVQELYRHGCIESNYKIIQKGNLFPTDKLTSNNISEGFVIYEKINL